MFGILGGCSGSSRDADGQTEEERRQPSSESDGGRADAARQEDASAAHPGAPTPNDAGPGHSPDGSLPGSEELAADPYHPIFDQEVLREYALEVDPDEWAHINETAYLEEYIKGRLYVDGEVYEPVGVRFKGFRGSLYNCFRFDDEGKATSRVCDKLSIKVSFNEYNRDGEFFGLRKLNFHSMTNDPSKLRERLAYFLFRRFGVPAPRAVHALLAVNGQVLGLYALVEQVDGRFTRMHFREGGKGNVYKERWPTSSTDPDYFKSGLKTNEDEPDVDVSPMVELAEALRDADETNIEQILREHTDFEALMRYLAVDRAIDNWDGITAFRCRPESEVPPLPPEVRKAQTPPLGWETCQNKNFYWYQESDSGKLWLTAWDTDISFPFFPSQFPPWDEPPSECEIRQSGRPPMCDPLIAAFATTLRPHYEEAARAFLQDVFHPDVVGPAVTAWAEQIAPHAPAEGLFAGDPWVFLDTVASYHAQFESSL